MNDDTTYNKIAPSASSPGASGEQIAQSVVHPAGIKVSYIHSGIIFL